MQGIYLGSLDSPDTTRLTDSVSPAVYAAGQLFWVRGGTALVAQRLDLERRQLVGSAATVADHVAMDVITGSIAVTASASGLIAYRTGSGGRRQLVWYDRSGKTLGVVGPPDDTALSAPRVSPDGRRVAVGRTGQGNQDIWLLDGARASRLTFDSAADRFPVWSPDGSRILFDSTRKGTRDLYVKSSSGAGDEGLVVESRQGGVDKSATDWSPDGRFVMYRSVEAQTGRDIWVLPLATGKPYVFMSTPFEENHGTFSSDGRWIAYESNETGRFEVYVRPFIDGSGLGAGRPGGKWQVSTDGGIQPRWRYDGREVYYLGPDGQMMEAPTRMSADAFDVGTPVKLFDTRIYGGGTDIAQGNQYDVTHDGRFLINTVMDEATAPITMLQNWKPPAN